jgi:hypothetical protein
MDRDAEIIQAITALVSEYYTDYSLLNPEYGFNIEEHRESVYRDILTLARELIALRNSARNSAR